MNKPELKREKIWILGSVIVGFAASFYLYFEGDATGGEIFELGFALSFLLWFIAVIMRIRSGYLEKGFLATAVKIIVIFGAIAGLISLTLTVLGIID